MIKQISLFVSVALSAGCATTTPITTSSDTTSGEYIAAHVTRVESIRPNNWSVEKKELGEDRYVVSRSLENDEYMWLTCRIEPTGIAGLSLGIVQPDAIGYKGDDANIIFSVDNSDYIIGSGQMVNESRAGLRSFDPRGNRFASRSEMDDQYNDWVNDPTRIAQYTIIDMMRQGDFAIGEIRLNGIGRRISVDLTGFDFAAETVMNACGAQPAIL